MSFTNPQLECCTSSPNCDLSNSIFLKDIYPPSYYSAPAISFSAISIVFIILAITTLTNFKRVAFVWKKTNGVDYLVMNILILFEVLCRFSYLFDGPIQLISGQQGETTSVYLTFEMLAIGFMNLCFAYSSYAWINIILMIKGVYQDKNSQMFIKVLFGVDFILISLIAVFNIVILFVPHGSVGLYFVLSSLITFINGVIFTASCYNLGANLSDMYRFDHSMTIKVSILKRLAILVGICSLLRIINDLSRAIWPNWQRDANLEAYCGQTFGWSAYLIFLMLIVEIVPLTFFLLLFRPDIKTRPRQGNLEDDFFEMSQTRVSKEVKIEEIQ